MNKRILEQFIPILIIFVLLAYPKTIIKFSHSILGRFVAVCIIIFYSAVDKYLGIIVCGLVILYYQTDYVEGMLFEMNENFEMISTNIITQKVNNADEEPDILTTLLSNSYQQFTYYKDLYNTNTNTNTNTMINKKIHSENFKKENCDKDGNLIFKESIIKLDMIEHIFPEINFSKDKCNPCDNNCRFTILEKKLITEDKMKPISTMQ
jgi:hypothetical protein